MNTIWKCHNLDQFAKVPQLYIDGKEEKPTIFGIITSLVYFMASFGMSVYFLTRMFSRDDFSVVHSTEYSTKYLSFNLSNKYAYFAFGVENASTYDYFIDDTIYYPKALFKQGVRDKETGMFVWIEKQLDIEPCKLRNFGEK